MYQDFSPDVILTQNCEHLKRLSLDPYDKTPENIKAPTIEKLAILVSRNNINDDPEATKAIIHGINFFYRRRKDPHRALRLTTAVINASPEGSKQETRLIETWHNLINLNIKIRDELYPHAREAFSSNKTAFKTAAAPEVVGMSFMHIINDDRVPDVALSLKEVHDFARSSGNNELAAQASEKLSIIRDEYPEVKISHP